MKIRTPKFRTLNLLEMKLKIIAVVLFSFSFVWASGQTMTYINNGTYKFETLFPIWDLHFWLYDDGYHSFGHTPSHQFKTSSVNSTPKFYHTKPYSGSDVNETSLGIASEGVLDPVIEVLELENQIEIKRSWNLVNGNDNFYILMFENINEKVISGCVEFHYNTLTTAISSNSILDDYNNNWVGNRTPGVSEYDGYNSKFSWTYQNLNPGEQRFIYIPAVCLAPSMDMVFARGIMKINECDEIVPENGKPDGSNNGVYDSKMYTLRSIVANNPHDPNFISSDPNCWNPNLAVPQTIRYKLQFQNEGIDPSQDVIVDFLSNARYGSVELINSSDGCLLTWDSDRINVYFGSIYIRGLNESDVPDYEETIGWVEIDVCYNLSSILDLNLECIELDAQVLFDGQDPILANSKVCEDLSCDFRSDYATGDCKPIAPSQQGGLHNSDDGYGNKLSTQTENNIGYNFELFPNPASDMIILKTDLLESIIVTNILGEIVLTDINLNGKEHVIDLSSMKSGLYYVKVLQKGKIMSKSFIKY